MSKSREAILFLNMAFSSPGVHILRGRVTNQIGCKKWFQTPEKIHYSEELKELNLFCFPWIGCHGRVEIFSWAEHIGYEKSLYLKRKKK